MRSHSPRHSPRTPDRSSVAESGTTPSAAPTSSEVASSTPSVRSLSSRFPERSSRPSASSPSASAAEALLASGTSLSRVAATLEELHEPAAEERGATTTTSSTPVSSPHNSLPPGVADLVAENKRLNECVLQLNEQLRCVLDHSIESDTRLLQYTDQVFVARTSRPDSLVRASAADLPVRASAADLPVRASAADCAVQCDLPTNCRDQRCAEMRDLVGSLRTTIEVLEAELRCMKEGCRDVEKGLWTGQGSGEWQVHTNKRSVPVVTRNRFEMLSEHLEAMPSRPKPPRNHPEKMQRRTRKNIPVPPSESSLRSQRVPLSFSAVDIEGDSHTRDLAGLVQHMVAGDVPVRGTCRPGAGLLSATTRHRPTPGSCTVIIAGTNDIAAGQQCNLYRHLEGRITSKLGTARVVVSTLPHRHDLPASHPIHQETELVNAYIEELCARHRGVEVLDFDHIKRGAFTKHGMHLKPKSKHLLAKLLVGCLQRLDRGTTSGSPPTPARLLQPSTTATTCGSRPAQALSTTATVSDLPSAPPRPQSPVTITTTAASLHSLPAQQPTPVACSTSHTLPFDTFADALKSLPAQHSVNLEKHIDLQKNCLNMTISTKG